MNRDKHSSIPIVVSAIAGITVWFVISGISGKSEAWDSQYYWSLGYPLLFLLCFILGWLYQKKSWAFGFVAMFVQALPMLFTNPSDMSLLPLGMIILGIISAPLSVSGLLGSWLGRKYSSRLV